MGDNIEDALEDEIVLTRVTQDILSLQKILPHTTVTTLLPDDFFSPLRSLIRYRTSNTARHGIMIETLRVLCCSFQPHGSDLSTSTIRSSLKSGLLAYISSFLQDAIESQIYVMLHTEVLNVMLIICQLDEGRSLLAVSIRF